MTNDLPASSADSANDPPPSLLIRVLSVPWGALTGVTFGAFLAVHGLQEVLLYQGTDTEPLASILVVGLIFFWLFVALCAVIQWLCDKAGIQRRPTSRSWRLAAGCSVAVGFACMLWSLMIPAVHQAQMAGRTQASLSSQANGNWVDHSVAGNQFFLSTPAHWEPFPDPALSSSALHLWDRQHDVHLLVSSSLRQDLTAATLKELSEQAVKRIASRGTDIQMGELQMSEVDGRPASDIGLTGTFDGVILSWYLRHVEYDDTWVEMTMWATHSKFTAHGETLDRIAASFRRAQ